MSASLPSISFTNSLDYSVTVYDSFSSQDPQNYFGTLTLLATVSPDTTAILQLIRKTSVLIVSNATANSPLARLLYIPHFSTGPLSVGQADVNAMAQTMEFITFITSNPNDPTTVAFNALWKDPSTAQVTPVNQFFAKQPTYASCTFATYMMGITYTAEQPVSKGMPMDQAVYSLSTLVKLLGGTWPPELPDIVVTKFTCNTNDGVVAIKAVVDVTKLPAKSDDGLKFFASLFDVQQFEVDVSINCTIGLSALCTQLSISLDSMQVPFPPGSSTTLTINKPTAIIGINPLFKFVVLSVTGDFPFNMFGTALDPIVSMVIDTVEVNCGAVIKEGNNTSLPAPPEMRGVHFDTFGVEMGIIFEPPGAEFGLTGQLHIGDAGSNAQVALDDDKFAVVCELEGDVPRPLYVSFYVPQMQLTDVITVFTNAQCPSLDVPVSFNDLSFQWTDDIMEPVALPDGTLSHPGYGFTAATKILCFTFYGHIKINLNSGLTANIEMSPLSLGSILSIGGDGKGISVKVDANGNPIKNNQLPTKAAQQQALQKATTKQLVAANGPVLNLQTTASPYLHVDGNVTLFEVENASLNANITSNGIEFEVDFGGVLSSTMSCTLKDLDNMSATFQFGINDGIPLPTIGGVSLGSLSLNADLSAHFSISTSSSDMIITVGGNFDFEGLNLTFGDWTVDVPIKTVSDLISAIETYIKQNAESIFSNVLTTASAWAGKVAQGVITGIASVANVLHNAFNQGAQEAASTMRDVGYGADDIASDLKQVFNPSDVAAGLQCAFGLSGMGVAKAMRNAGYSGPDVAPALQAVFGNDPTQIASALSNVFGMGPGQVQGVLGQIGFSPGQIGQAFQSLGGAFGQALGIPFGQTPGGPFGQIPGGPFGQIPGSPFGQAGQSIENTVNTIGNDLNPLNW